MQDIRAWNIAIESPCQIFLTITMISLQKIAANPMSYNSAHSTIDLSWWPIVTITYSVLTILVSFLSTASQFFIEADCSLKLGMSLPIFIFRMLVWQVLIILLADLSFLVVGSVLLFNIGVLLIAQKDGIILDPFSHAVKALVFPKLIKINSEEVRKTFHLFIVGGNCILMFGWTALFIMCSVGSFDPWKGELNKSLLISKAWFETIFWATIPLFFAATLPAFSPLCDSR
jgi:hypothetical protein